ncbi:MAG: hypothetical protein Q9217_006634 [Psora testacea]
MAPSLPIYRNNKNFDDDDEDDDDYDDEDDDDDEDDGDDDGAIAVVTGESNNYSSTASLPPKSDGIINRRRANSSARSGTKSQLPLLQINLANAQKQFRQPNSHYPFADDLGIISSSEAPTAPIAIPQQKQRRPTTPLTGRPNVDVSRDSFFTKALELNPSTWGSKSSSDRSASPMQAMGPRTGQQPNYHQPSSPLSPSIPILMPHNEPQHKENPRPQNLHLHGLPKFHPLNFPNSDSNIPLSPRSARAIASQARNTRLGSDAQQRLQQYQRAVLVNTTRTAHSMLSQATVAKPESPRLAPRGSPSGPITPLMLEEQAQGDYLMAGSGLSLSHAVNRRDLVEKLVQKENERRQHPEAASASLSPSVSPAVSRACGGV